MALTREAQILTEAHKRRQEALTSALLVELLRLWRQIVNPSEPRTFQAFAEAAAVVIGARRAESAALAADYYAAFRAAEGVAEPGPLIAGTALVAAGETPEVQPREVPRDRLVGLIRGAAMYGMVAAVRSGASPAQALDAAMVRVQGSASRVVLNGGRDLLVDAVRRDPAAIGWYRVTDADPCHFCAMLASRGLMKKSVTITDRTRWVRTPTGRRVRPRIARVPKLEVHDHDQCTLEPAFEGSEPPGTVRQYRELWDRVTDGLSGREARLAFRHALEGRE